MSQRRSIVNCVMQLALSLILAAPLAAQIFVEEGDNRDFTIYRMTVSPAPEPEPALKFRLR